MDENIEYTQMGAKVTPPIQYAYTIIVDKDGVIHTEASEAGDSVFRKATTFDIYSSAKDLVTDIESQLLADRISKAVLAGMQTSDGKKEAREKLLSALSDRGIETPKA